MIAWFTHELWRWLDEFSDGKLVNARVYADTAILRDTVAGITPR